MKKIAVIGSLNVDYVAYTDHAPATGETVLGTGFEIVPGGKGANQAYAIGRMGAEVVMLGAVGKDANADIERSNLQKAGVLTTHLLETDQNTGVALITVEGTGDNRIVVAQGANLQVSPAYIDRMMPVLEGCDIVVMQLEIPLETVVYAAKKLKGMGKTVVLDPAPAPGKLPEELYAHIDYIKPNETELAMLTGVSDAAEHPEAACSLLLDAGVGCVLASLGGRGVYAAAKGGGKLYPAKKVPVVDTTAAGDSFTAAFVYALSRDCAFERAITFANAVAGVVVQRKGAQASIPDKGEIDAIWEEVMGV